MNKEEFSELFGKTTFIEHLNERQQKELYETVKGLIPGEKVREAFEKWFMKQVPTHLSMMRLEGNWQKAYDEFKKELGLE